MQIKSVVVLLAAVITGCHPRDKGAVSPRDHFEFDAGETTIRLNADDSNYLVNYYQQLKADRIDTLEWPCPANRRTVQIVVDVSGSMFNKKYDVLKNDTTYNFFDYSLNELVTFFHDQDFFSGAVAVKIKIFGMADYEHIVLPAQKVMVNEYYYPQDNKRITVKIIGTIAARSFNIADSVKASILRLAKNYKSTIWKVGHSPLLQSLIMSAEDLQATTGKKSLLYLTDGFFQIKGDNEFIPHTTTSLTTIKNQFGTLRARMMTDSSFHFVLFGMNTMHELSFRDKMNNFYRWFLKDSINHLSIYNLQ